MEIFDVQTGNANFGVHTEMLVTGGQPCSTQLQQMFYFKLNISDIDSTWLGAVAESVVHWSHARETVGSNPGRVKPMTN